MRSKKILRVVLIVLAAAAGLWLFSAFVLPVVLPFFIALAVARLAQPAVDFLQRRGRLPRWLVKRCSFQKGYWK